MNKKKLLLYGSIVLLLCAFWAVYIGMSLQAIDRSTQQSLRETAAATRLQIEKSMEYQGLELLFELGEYDLEAEDIGEMLPVLRRLEESNAGQAFCVARSDGTITGADGGQVEAVLGAATLRQAMMEGSAITSMVNTQQGWDGVAMVVPLPGSRELYLVRVETLERFARSLLQEFSSRPEYLAVYNNWGVEIYTAFVGTEPAKPGEVAATVLTGAQEYSMDSAAAVKRIGLGRDYNVYFALAQPEGWFLGMRVETTQAAPVSASMLQTAVLAFASWLLLALVIIVLDVYNDREKQREFTRASRMDSLTGLYNSAGMESAMTGFFHKNGMVGYSLVLLDIVAFRRFNTMFGHVAGDSLLRSIGSVLREKYDCGTRMSGDIFGFLAKTSGMVTTDAERRLVDALEQDVGKKYLQMISFKFGVYPILDESRSFREIYDGALLALRDAKKIVESEVIYDSKLQQNMDLQRDIEMNMLHALSKEEFLVYIQPKFSVKEEVCCGGEALVRWQSEQIGFMPPDQFIPLFEKNGFIVEIDFFMLKGVMEAVKGQIAGGRNPYRLSVNQSRVTITFPNYLERLESLVNSYSIPLEYVELEITESTLENDSDSVIPIIQALKRMGFTVAMDDFGIGFSSLNTLRELPVDVLKIDKEFLRESDTSGRSKKIIRNIINMSKELGIEVVCEGVETMTQMDFLRDAGCDVAQGYYFSKPVPLEDYEQRYITGQP